MILPQRYWDLLVWRVALEVDIFGINQGGLCDFVLVVRSMTKYENDRCFRFIEQAIHLSPERGPARCPKIKAAGLLVST
jgi:hypothetical protein